MRYLIVFIFLLLVFSSCYRGREPIGGHYYSKGNKVYYRYTANLMPMIPISYDSWEEMKGADAKSFVVFNEYFAKDKNHIYYKKSVVEVAEPQSFRIDSTDIYRDDKHIYKYEGFGWTCKLIPLEGVDAKTYQLIEGCPSGWGKDKNHVYYKYKIINGADPQTFD